MTNLTGINNWGGTPYQMPMLPLPQFDWNTAFNCGLFNFTTPASPAGKSSADESYEDYKKRIQAELEADRTKLKTSFEERALSEKKVEEIKPLQEEVDKIDKQVNDIKSGTQKDGSVVVRPKSKELGFWSKAGRWLGNAGAALKNMGKAIAGFEEDGSWNWKKCARNVAITVAAVGACFIPFVGPAIGFGLAAAGVAGAGVGIAKGVSRLSKARSEAEIDKAQQDICANAFIGITAAFGMRGVKGLKASMQADKTLVASKGFRGAYNSKVSSAWKNVTSWENKYNKSTQLEASAKQNIVELDNRINTMNRIPGSSKIIRKILLKRRNVQAQKLSELRRLKNTKTKSELDALAETCTKDVRKLIKYRENMMRTKAKTPDKYASELAEYIPSPNAKKCWYKPSTWRKNEYQLAIGGKNPSHYKELLGLTLTSQASTVPKVVGGIERGYSGPMLMSAEYTSSEAKEVLAKLEAQKADLESKIAGINNLDLATYKNALANKAT